MERENNPTSFSLEGKLPCYSMAQPTIGQGYMIVARDLLQGVEALSTFKNISDRACAMIAAHALECTLKAFLWHRGKKIEISKIKVRHNIETLWKMAYMEKDLSIPKTPPDWVKVLALGHRPNYYYRYQIGQGKTVVHAGSTPELMPMAVGLRRLVEIVKLATKGYPKA